MQTSPEPSQNVVKSIIYGNIVPTSYGMHRALCSAISSKDHVDKITLYLRNNHNFLKYNYYLYAFRLQHLQHQFFITEDQQQKPKFLEGYSDDSGFEGVGEKLLALLQKFNVRNVLVILAVRQKDPLKELYPQHFVEMVRSAKQLLSSLYQKVVVHSHDGERTEEREVEKQVVEIKEYQIPVRSFEKTAKTPLNPNYVGLQFVKKGGKTLAGSQHQSQITFLNIKIKELASALQAIIEKFGEPEDAQVKFSIKYDQNKRVQKVFQMLAQLFSFTTPEAFLESSMSNHLKSITTRNLSAQVIRHINEELMSDRSLRSELLAEENQVCGILVQFLQVLIKSYGFARKLAVIEAEIQERQEFQNKSSKRIPNYNSKIGI